MPRSRLGRDEQRLKENQTKKGTMRTLGTGWKEERREYKRVGHKKKWGI